MRRFVYGVGLAVFFTASYLLLIIGYSALMATDEPPLDIGAGVEVVRQYVTGTQE